MTTPTVSDTRGLLVTFEGPEGSGKTTLVAGIEHWLAANGCEALVLREPGGTKIGERIRAVLLDPAAQEMCGETELLLMVASRAQLVREKIEPALEAGIFILCDRFADASVAYQGFGRGLGEKLVHRLNAVALAGIEPDLTFLCLLPPEQGRARVAARETDRLEREAQQFHARVYSGYQAMAASGDSRYVVLDAALPPAEVLATALIHLRRLGHGLLKFL